MPQFQGAGLSLGTVAGTPPWVGGVLVGAVVLVNVFFGGMRSITLVQAFQYWLKLTALLRAGDVPARGLDGDGAASPADPPVAGGVPGDVWADPLAAAEAHPLYTTYSMIVATFLGTMGLPHVVVRFYTNPDGRTARRTTLVVLGLLGLFYVLPSRVRRPRPALRPRPDAPRRHRHRGARAAGPDGRRSRRRAAVGAHRRRGVRGVPVHLLGPDHRGGRGASART